MLCIQAFRSQSADIVGLQRMSLCAQIRDLDSDLDRGCTLMLSCIRGLNVVSIDFATCERPSVASTLHIRVEAIAQGQGKTQFEAFSEEDCKSKERTKDRSRSRSWRKRFGSLTPNASHVIEHRHQLAYNKQACVATMISFQDSLVVHPFLMLAINRSVTRIILRVPP